MIYRLELTPLVSIHRASGRGFGGNAARRKSRSSAAGSTATLRGRRSSCLATAIQASVRRADGVVAQRVGAFQAR